MWKHKKEKNSMLRCKSFIYASCCSLGALKCSDAGSRANISVSLVTYYTTSLEIRSIFYFFSLNVAAMLILGDC